MRPSSNCPPHHSLWFLPPPLAPPSPSQSSNLATAICKRRRVAHDDVAKAQPSPIPAAAGQLAGRRVWRGDLASAPGSGPTSRSTGGALSWTDSHSSDSPTSEADAALLIDATLREHCVGLAAHIVFFSMVPSPSTAHVALINALGAELACASDLLTRRLMERRRSAASGAVHTAPVTAVRAMCPRFPQPTLASVPPVIDAP